MTDADDPRLGMVVGSWRLTYVLGTGGMGRVYAAVQPAIGGRVAIKVLTREAAPDVVERFFNEARAVNLIRHDNIVDVIDLGPLPDGSPYIVMEHLDGASLGTILRRTRTLPPGASGVLIDQVLAALEAAHAKGVIHRDLKPDNVFVSDSGHVTVLDFGVAKLARAEGMASTQTGSLLGTPAYMSPEQARSQPIDPRSDLYSVGVMLYEASVGRLPFIATNMFDLLDQHVRATPSSPRSLDPSLPEPFEAVILRALAKEPAQRFASAAEMRAALADAVAGLPRSLPVISPNRAAALADAATVDSGDASARSTQASLAATPTTQASLARGEAEPRAQRPPAIQLSRKALFALIGAAAAIGVTGAVIAVIAMRGGDRSVPQPPPTLAQVPPDASLVVAQVPPDASLVVAPVPLDATVPDAALPDAGAPAKAKLTLVKRKDGAYGFPIDAASAREPFRHYRAIRALVTEIAGAPVAPYNLELEKLDRQGRLLPGGRAQLQFMSRAAAAAGRHCLYNVVIDASGPWIDLGDFDNGACDAWSVGELHCTLEQLLAKGQVPADAAQLRLVRNTADEWDITAGDLQVHVADECR